MRKLISIVFIFIICFVSTFVYAENETNYTNEVTNGTTDLQTEQQELKDKMTQANEQLGNVQSDLSENLQQVQKLDEKIANAESELQKWNEQINTLKSSVAEIEQKLEEQTEKYNKQKSLFEQRMVAIYEAGNTQYLDIILNASSITEFLSSYYVISEIAENDTELLNQIGELKDEIDRKKQKLENERTQLATIIENETKTARILKNTKVVRESFITKLSEEEKTIQKDIDEYNQRFAEINQQILALAKQGLDTSYIGGQLAWPVPGYTRITSQYGMRTHPITGIYKLHTGVDVGAPMGANFVAANDGIVVKAEYNGAYGKMVIIDHGGGISTLYAHGSEILVEVGQTVTREQPILKVGSTGYSTGAHAHFEVRINGVVTNPMPYITNGVIPGTDQNTSQEENTSNQTQN